MDQNDHVLIRKMEFLLSLDAEERGRGYGGYAAEEFVTTMRVALKRLVDLTIIGKTVVSPKPLPYPDCLCGDLDNGDAVVDGKGRVWTVCRDGGMVVRPAQGNVSNIESAGLHWLETARGPVTVIYKKPEEMATSGTFSTVDGTVHEFTDSAETISNRIRSGTGDDAQ